MSNFSSHSPVRLSIPDPPLFSASECYFAGGKDIQIIEKQLSYMDQEDYHQLSQIRGEKWAHVEYHPREWFLFSLNPNDLIIAFRKDVNFNETLLVNVLVHELGHTLALPHDKDEYDIMYWKTLRCNRNKLCVPSEKNIQVFLKRQFFTP